MEVSKLLIYTNTHKKDLGVLLMCIIYFAVLLFVAFFTNGTCDSGDSITHFLFAKFAFAHPENFLNHWAKPFFVLISSYFAQFGFIGIKIFNCINAFFSCWLVYQIALQLKFKNPFLAPIILIFIPGYFIHIFSGLTEPLFALILLLGLYYLLRNQLLISSILISLLPFVRSEGLIIIGIFAFYFLIHKHYKYLFWLCFGHILYSIAGYLYYQDFLWIFTKIPYAHSSGKYGSGDVFHFIVQLNYILGIPVYALFYFGFIKKTVELIKNRTSFFDLIENVENVFIYFLVVIFIVMHSIFWHYGLFESMGLNRVLIAIVPLISLIALNGINLFSSGIKNRTIKIPVIAIIMGYVLTFDFTPNPASINWEKDFSISEDQKLIDSAANYINRNFSNDYFLKYSHPYVAISLNRDPFDTSKNSTLNGSTNHILKMKIIIWDDWFSRVENGISRENLLENSKIKILRSFSISKNDCTKEVIVGKEIN